MQPLINGQTVEILDYFKNLGTYINVFLILRKTLATFLRNAHNASTLLHKLNNFGVGQNILEIVFQSLVQSVSFNIAMWYGKLNTERQNKLQNIVNMAPKIIGDPQKQLSNIKMIFWEVMWMRIINDLSYPLYSEFELLP